eukprot:scaffold11961_cov122-Cylindrotheca_fusiformis.AAC.2
MCVPSLAKIDTSDPNAVLEDQVRRLILKSQRSNNADPVLEVASKPKLYDGVVRAGTPIYVSRSRLPVVFFSLLATCAVTLSLTETNVIALALCTMCSLIGYDLLSGFLHVVFDNPDNLYIPVLGQPCLEFQMHHHFPTDLVQRRLLDVFGDLNTVISVLAVWCLLLMNFSNPIPRYMAGLKLAAAYYGQFSHRSAHTPSTANSVFIEGLRSVGAMIPLAEHRSHHRPPHNNNFCLVGVCNPVVDFLYNKVTRNRQLWMIGFFAIGLGCIPVEAILMEKFLTSTGIV